MLKKVKVGDTIMATVYKGDTTLYNVQVMPADNPDTKKSKYLAVRCAASRIALLEKAALGQRHGDICSTRL